MRVLNHVELEGPLARSGIGTAVDQQRAALAATSWRDVAPQWCR